MVNNGLTTLRNPNSKDLYLFSSSRFVTLISNGYWRMIFQYYHIAKPSKIGSNFKIPWHRYVFFKF